MKNLSIQRARSDVTMQNEICPTESSRRIWHSLPIERLLCRYYDKVSGGNTLREITENYTALTLSHFKSIPNILACLTDYLTISDLKAFGNYGIYKYTTEIYRDNNLVYRGNFKSLKEQVNCSLLMRDFQI